MTEVSANNTYLFQNNHILAQHRKTHSQYMPQINEHGHLMLHPKVFIMIEKIVSNKTIVQTNASTTIFEP